VLVPGLYRHARPATRNAPGTRASDVHVKQRAEGAISFGAPRDRGLPLRLLLRGWRRGW